MIMRFRNVTVVVALCGIGLLESVGHASDFGLIHFYGSVLYSGCYVWGTQNQPVTFIAHDRNDKSVNFGMRFRHCRLVERGQVLAEVSVLHNDWDTLGMLQTDGYLYSIRSIQTGDTNSRFPLNGFLGKVSHDGEGALQFRHEISHDQLTHRDVSLEIIYR